MRALRLASVVMLVVALIGCPAEGDPSPEPGEAAAVVDGEAIPTDEVERRYDELEQADRTQEDQATMRARILSQLIVAHVTETGAQEMDVDVDDEEVREVRAELAESVGGEDELERYMAQAGVSPERLDEELRSLALLHAIGERRLDDEPSAGATDDDRESAIQDAARSWLDDRLDEAEIEVDAAYGDWDAERRHVVPPDSARA